MRKILACCAIWLMACGSDEKQVSADKSFFDLLAFSDSCVAQFSKPGLAFSKTMQVNGVQETQANAKVQWAKDLALLREFDINKPSWRKSFAVKEQQTASGHELVYTALDSTTTVKYLRVVFDSIQRPCEVFALRHAHNMLYTIWQQAHLVCDSIYDVQTRQEIWMLKDKEYRLTTVFSKGINAGQ